MATSTSLPPTSSSYLTDKTSTLENQTPVPPSQAKAAQIPLKDFNLPTFPPEAFSAGLTSLILTSDIKMDEYQELLDKEWSVPNLPSSITSLSLELFALGYPRGFLTELGKKLSGVRNLTVYSQLFGGTTPESREDATTFLSNLKGLKEVHFLDVFTPHTVMQGFETAISEDVGFIEVSYTYRHSDPEFLKTLPKCELGGFIKKSTKALRLAMQSPDVSERDEEDREGTEEGIFPIPHSKDTEELVAKVKENGGGLVLLDLTLFELHVDDLIAVLGSCKELKVLAVSVSLESGWDELVEQLKGRLVNVESLEIVGVPGAKMVNTLKEGKVDGHLNEKMADALGNELKGVNVSILRTQGESWTRDQMGWVRGGV